MVHLHHVGGGMTGVVMAVRLVVPLGLIIAGGCRMASAEDEFWGHDDAGAHHFSSGNSRANISIKP